MAWRVRFAPATGASSQAGERDHVIVAYKENVARDPDAPSRRGCSRRVGRNLVGSAYNGCITPRVQQPGPPMYRYYAWAPAPGLEPRWLFAHTGVTRLDAHSRHRRLRARPAHARHAARHAPDRHGRRCALPCRGRALAGARHAGRDDALSGALGRARVRHRHARLGVRALARAPGLARRAAQRPTRAWWR